jgi:DNA polymerase (family X)
MPLSRLTKSEVILVLRSIAALHEFHGDNPFKSRAYENAARALAEEQASLDDILNEPKRLESLRGIGSSIAGIIREAAETGQCNLLEKLRTGTPAGIYHLMQIPNLGPKKIAQLYQNLGISTVEELEAACSDGSIAELKGFGKRTAEKIASGIDQFRRFSGRWLFPRASAAAKPFVAALRDCPAVKRVEIAGSLRRCREVVADIDIVASTDDSKAAMDCFTGQPNVSQVINYGETKSTVLLVTGMQADLRVVPDEQFATALHHFTGSKEHNVRLRGHARAQGMKVNEYGLYRVEQANTEAEDAQTLTALPIGTEEDLYRNLGLAYIPPELREDMGEIQAAAAGKLPDLIRGDDYLGVLHCHSTWSDGLSSIRDLALAVRERDMQYIAICDHSQAAAYARGLKPEALAEQQQEIDALNDELADERFRILKGCECDILPDGSLDYPDELLATMDVVVASVHSRFQMPEAEMTARLIRAIENPYVTMIGHLSGRLLLAREPYAFDLAAVVARACECGTVLEINADPHRLDLDWRHCHEAKELGALFSINPDAHSVDNLEFISYGINVARKGWLTRHDVINCLPLGEFLAKVQDLRRCKLRRAR